MHFSEEEVLEAILGHTNMMPLGCAQITLRLASSVISQSLAAFFTSVVRHGYNMPAYICDCVMVPLLKEKRTHRA